MRILQINNFHYRKGGSEAVYFNTSELLEKKGHQVAHFSIKSQKNLNSPYSDFFIDNPDFFELSLPQKVMNAPKFFFSKEAPKKLELLINEFKPEVAHVHLLYGGITSSVLPLLKKYNIPVVFTLHDYKLLCPVYTFLDGRGQICETCMNNCYVTCFKKSCNKGSKPISLLTALECMYRDKFYAPEKYVSKFINVSQFSLQKHLDKQDWQGKMEHLYNFIPNLKDINVTKSSDNYFLYLGRLVREKGTSTLVDAFGKVNSSAQLKIVGTGPLDDELKHQVKNNYISNIELLGYKTGNDLEDLIRNAKVIIVPSEWYENNPMSVIEAYAYGKPVIASNIGGLPEIVENGKTGFLFEPGNTASLSEVIDKVLHISDVEYDSFSQNARQFAEDHFSEEIHYQKLITIYQDALKTE